MKYEFLISINLSTEKSLYFVYTDNYCCRYGSLGSIDATFITSPPNIQDATLLLKTVIENVRCSFIQHIISYFFIINSLFKNLSVYLYKLSTKLFDFLFCFLFIILNSLTRIMYKILHVVPAYYMSVTGVLIIIVLVMDTRKIK